MEGLLLNHGEKFRLPCPGRNRRKKENVCRCIGTGRHFFIVYEQLLVVAVARYHTNTANTKNVEKLYRSFFSPVV